MKTKVSFITRSGMFLFILLGLASMFHPHSAFAQEKAPFNNKPENVTDFTINPLPPGWDTYSVVGNPHGIIVMLGANPRINDIPILPGDYIGTFYEDDNGDLKCGGADYWLGDENIIFGAFGTDPDTPEKDGFVYGEQIYFKFYSYTTFKEYDVDLITFDPTTYSGTDNWYPLAISQIIDMASLVNFDAYALATPNPVCIGNSVDLEANIFIGTTGNYTYSWTSDPAGFTSGLQNPTVSPNESITYFLEVSDGVLISEDQVNVIVNLPATVVAGPDGTICEDEQAHLTATATNYGGILWTTSGDGTFDNFESLNPFYSPGPVDAENGFATLTVVALPLDDCILAPSDEIAVSVSRLPNLNLPASASFCEIEEIWVSVDVDNYSSLTWNSSGNGTFSDPNAATTRYFPGSFDLSLGEFTLTCCAGAASPCSGTDCVQMFCELSPPSTVNAPGSRTACENLPVPLISVAFNYSSVLWTTAGDGYFENPQALSTNYIPGILDIENGGTIVTINAFGFGACLDNPAKKNVNVIVKPRPKVDAGDIDVVCGSQPIQLNGSVEDYLSFQWSTSGDGYFTSVSVQSPIYYPGSNDISNAGFNLTLTAQPIAPCIGAVSDVLEIEIIDQAQVEIATPSNQILCAGLNLQLEAMASGYNAILWETTGDGYFDDPNVLNPVYFHGPLVDLSGSPVILKITAFVSPVCGDDVFDEINVSYADGASSYAGEDFAACGDDLFVSGSAENYASVLWETNGDGYFVEPGLLNTQYIPGVGDLASGSAELCLVALGFGDCPDASDCLTINIFANPIADIGIDEATICYGEDYSFDQVTFSNASSLNWFTTDGGGSFDNPTGSNPNYSPDPETDYALGCIQIGVTAQPISPCELAAEDFMQLCFQAPPLIDIGLDDVEICQGYNFSFTTVVASNNEGVTWFTSNGGGFFNNPNDLNPIYFPDPEIDYPLGCIILNVSAEPMNPCTVSAEDEMELCFAALPEVNAGPDATIVDNETYNTNPTAANYSSVLWSTSGDGSFMHPNEIETNYMPGQQDIQNESVQLILTAYPLSTCPEPAIGTLTLTIMRQQNIEFQIGWNGFSSFIDPPDPDFEEVVSPISSQLEFAQNMTEVYWPEYGINTIGEYKNNKGYKVKLNANATLPITGFAETNKTVSIPEGWSTLPVISDCAVPYTELIAQLSDKLIAVTEIGGTGMLYPGQGIYNLPNLVPGKAYSIKLTEGADFTFPDCLE